MAKRKNPVGTCGLCMQIGELQHSHVLPAAAYRVCRSPQLRNPHPVLVTRKGFYSSSRQSWAHLLCRKCERQLNDNGEREVFGWLNNGREFRLLERLTLANPSLNRKALVRYPEDRIGVSTQPFVYFAVSVVWRAAVRGSSGVAIDPYEPLVRQYLLGTGALPPDVMVVVAVCSDALSARILQEPSPVVSARTRAYGFVMCGTYFTVTFPQGPVPALEKRFLGLTSHEKCFAMGNCAPNTMKAFKFVLQP